MSYGVSVVGASGYAGGEAIKLISAHPALELEHICAHTSTGSLADYHPSIASYCERDIEPTRPEVLAHSDIVILGLPHGASASVASSIHEINPNVRIVDLGADHRLEDPHAWREFYGSEPHEPWAYAMPELIRTDGQTQREILSTAHNIASPGCNASAVTFAIQPLAAYGLALPHGITATLAVGYTGAGKSLKPHLLASAAVESALAYNVGGKHRHIPEIMQNIAHAGLTMDGLSFTPILVPMARGICASVSIPVREGTTQSDIDEAYRQAYADEYFVRMSKNIPTPAQVRGSNSARIWATLDKNGQRVTVISVIDNLVKGTAGAAIQSVNIALGLPEHTGLPINGGAP